MADTSLTMNVLAKDRGATDTLRRVARATESIDSRTVRTNETLDTMSSKFNFVALRGQAMTAIVGTAIGALPAIATAASGAIVGALGGGLATVGIMAAAQSERVQTAFTELRDHVVSTVTELAKPFEPVLVRIAQMARDTFDAFVPALRGAFKQMAPAIEGFAGDLARAFKELKPAIGPLTDAFTQLMRELGPELPEIFRGLADGIISVSDALRGNMDSFINIIKFLGDLTEGILKLTALMTRFSDEIMGVMIVVGILAAVFGGVVAAVLGVAVAIGAAIGLIITHWDTIKAATKGAWEATKMIISAAWRAIKAVVMAAVRVVKTFVVGAWNAVKATTVAVWNAIKGATIAAWNAIKTAVMTAINTVKSIVMSVVNSVVGFITGAWNRARGMTSSAWNSIVSAVSGAINTMLGFVSSIPGRIVGALGNLGGLLFSAGQRVIQGLINGVRSMIGAVADAASAAASAITGALPFSPAEFGPLRDKPPDEAGQNIVRQLEQGLLQNRDRIAEASRAIAGQVDFTGADAGMGELARSAAAQQGQQVGLAAGDRGGQQQVTVNLDVSGADEDMKRLIRKMTRVDGQGDVQKAFGQ